MPDEALYHNVTVSRAWGSGLPESLNHNKTARQGRDDRLIVVPRIVTAALHCAVPICKATALGFGSQSSARRAVARAMRGMLKRQSVTTHLQLQYLMYAGMERGYFTVCTRAALGQGSRMASVWTPMRARSSTHAWCRLCCIVLGAYSRHYSPTLTGTASSPHTNLPHTYLYGRFCTC